MSRSIIARFRCDKAEAGQDSDQIALQAVYSSSASAPNNQWSKWTPSGSLHLTITNPPARGMFEHGEEYDVIVRPARYSADEIAYYQDQAAKAEELAAKSPTDQGLQNWAASTRKQYERAASRPA